MEILRGLRVIDLTQFISGARCTQILADMGAEVVKIEPPQGDTLRLIYSLMPPGAGRHYSVLNRNKYGLCVDWRQPEGREILLRLAAVSDLFVHNLIPGTLERSQLGYEDLIKVKPDLIYVSISGFGSTGTNPERAAFDIIAQATSGMFWNTLDNLIPPSNHWGDLVSGAYAATASLLAIIHRMKTSQGQHVDLSMQDVLYFNHYRAMCDRATAPVREETRKVLGRDIGEIMNSKDRMPFYGFFKTRDGTLAIVAMTPRQWRDLTAVISHPEMATDPKFSNFVTQVRNHKEAVTKIEEWTQSLTSEEIMDILESKKIPCGIAYSIDQLHNDLNLKERGMFQSVEHEKFGTIDVPGIPFKFSHTAGTIRRPAPELGEHNRDILHDWLGYTPEEIKRFQQKAVISPP